MKAGSATLSKNNKAKAALKRRRLMTFLKFTLGTVFVGAALSSFFILKDDIALIKQTYEKNETGQKIDRIGLNNYNTPAECEPAQQWLYKCQFDSKKRSDQCLNQVRY